MKIGKINTDKKVFIIAEIGNNHEGNFKLAKKMINEAAVAGVDAVKFQTFIPEKFVSIEDTIKEIETKKTTGEVLMPNIDENAIDSRERPTESQADRIGF